MTFIFRKSQLINALTALWRASPFYLEYFDTYFFIHPLTKAMCLQYIRENQENPALCVLNQKFLNIAITREHRRYHVSILPYATRALPLQRSIEILSQYC